MHATYNVEYLIFTKFWPPSSRFLNVKFIPNCLGVDRVAGHESGRRLTTCSSCKSFFGVSIFQIKLYCYSFTELDTLPSVRLPYS